jgi:hypothetical protein
MVTSPSKIPELAVGALLSKSYGILDASLGERLREISVIQQKPSAEARSALSEMLGYIFLGDAEFRKRIEKEVAPEDLAKFTEIMLRLHQFYYANEGYYWVAEVGFVELRKALKDVRSQELLNNLKFAIGIGGGEPEFKGFFWLAATFQIEAAKASAESHYDYFARELMIWAVYDLLMELYLKPSEEFLNPPEGGRSSLTELMDQPLDEKGKELSKKADSASFGELCVMADTLLGALNAKSSRFGKYLMGFDKENVAILKGKGINVKGSEPDYGEKVKGEEAEILSNILPKTGNAGTAALLKKVAAVLRSSKKSSLSEGDREELNILVGQLTESEARELFKKGAK